LYTTSYDEKKLIIYTQIQAGMIVFDSGNLSTAATTYFNAFNELLESRTVPDNLDLQPSILNIPNVGTVFSVTFVWAGPRDDRAKEWQAIISALAPVMMSTVKTTTLATYVAEITSVIPPVMYPGICRTVSLRDLRLSNSAIETFARYAELQPKTAGLMTFHSMHGSFAGSPPMPSIFRNREAHYMLEIIGLSVVPEGGEEEKIWANRFGDEMGKAEGNLESTYLPLTPTELVDLKKVYGEHLDKLVALKKEVDPKNVFRHTLPELRGWL